jgi:hypothetical protein
MRTKAVPKNQNRSQPTKTHVGDVVYVRYYDAVLFKDTLSSQIKPLLREAVGWLDFENTEYIRLVWERYAEPTINEESRIRQTGLAIRRSDIIEVKKVA